jgi:ABC-type hemin transport system ATPase subunit
MTAVLASSLLNQAGPVVDDLHTGELQTMPFNVLAGTYVRGQVLAMNANDLEAVSSTNVANARAVMPHDVTLAAAAITSVYVFGHFNEDKVTIGTATLAAVKTALHPRGVFLRKWTPAN